MRTGIDAICAALGLGAPCGPPEPVTGGSSVAGWRVPTARGRWLVKTMSAPAGWQLHEMRVAGRLERAAAHGPAAVILGSPDSWSRLIR